MAANNAINNTLQTPFTLGATSVTSTGTQLNYLAGLTAVPINKVNVQVISATGASTYTPTAGSVYFIVEIWGAGGGGGGADGSAGQCGAAGGGAGGGYCRKFYNSTEMGADAAVSIGTGGTAGAAGNNNGSAGGNSTFNPAGTGVTLTANGGAGGAGSAKTATQTNANGGSPGGGGTNGDINISGTEGFPGLITLGSGGYGIAGYGGASYGTPPNVLFTMSGSNDGVSPGQGGTGGFGAGATAEGGDGANGRCIVTEFISS